MASSKLTISLFLLALVSIVVGDNTTRVDCFGRAEYDGFLERTSERVRQLNSTNLEHLLPPANGDRFGSYCSEIVTRTACVEASTRTHDKRDMLVYLKTIADIVCAFGIQQKYACLLNVSGRPAPAECEQCSNYKQWFRFIAYSPAEPDGPPLVTVMKGTCQYFNCWTRCRKNLITATCEQSGYDAVKKMLTVIGRFFEQWPDLVQNPGTDDASISMPNECKVDGITKDL